MLQHSVQLQNLTMCKSFEKLYKDYLKLEIRTLHLIETYVLIILFLFVILLPLSCLKKRFNTKWINLPLWGCYMACPILTSYTLGLMGDSKNSLGSGKEFTGLYSIWGSFLLFVYSSFDNFSALKLEERNDRSQILFQFCIKYILLSNLIQKTFGNSIGSRFLVLTLLVMETKVVARFSALAYAAGSPIIKDCTRRIIDYMNEKDEEEVEVDPVSMQGFKYLAGPKFLRVKDGKIIDGITVEVIWNCQGRLLSSGLGGGDPDGKLKDTCLSFALFWLLLGKFWGYPLYEVSSKRKAMKLVYDVLLAKRGEHERVFRVIEVELSFLQDYFYTNYIYYYFAYFLNQAVLILLAFPATYWWCTTKAVDYKKVNSSYLLEDGVYPNVNSKATAAVMWVVFSLEVIQLIMLLASRWLKVTLIHYYASKGMSKENTNLQDRCIEKVISAICRFSPFTAICRFLPFNGTILWKPWKRQLDQYSLLKFSTSFGIKTRYITGKTSITSWERYNSILCTSAGVLGIPIRKPGRKQGESVVLSEHVKRAVVLSLRTNGPELSNGMASLRRNGVSEEISWPFKLKKDAEIILVWHLATSICEMNPNSQQSGQLLEDFEVATQLSKYCAYLLAFAPSLLSVPPLEADAMCDTVIEEARALFKEPFSPCGKVKEINKFDKVMGLNVQEEDRQKTTTLQKGAKLGKDLLTVVEDEGKRWKILAEFWAEMILFLAPSNSNEMVHAEKLAEGGEFITHLWALLIHAGIVDRGDSTRLPNKKMEAAEAAA